MKDKDWISSQGRFNSMGHGELYTCNDFEVAIKEAFTTLSPDIVLDVIEWEVQQPLKVLDLTRIESPLVKYCSLGKQTPNSQEYLLPNYLAQCAKLKRINAIVFNSTKN